MSYRVTITEVIAKEYVVEADSEEEAEHIVQEGNITPEREKLIDRTMTDITEV